MSGDNDGNVSWIHPQGEREFYPIAQKKLWKKPHLILPTSFRDTEKVRFSLEFTHTSGPTRNVLVPLSRHSPDDGLISPTLAAIQI